MKYNELSVSHTAKTRKRVGRGIAAGQGKTAGRGTKGQNARTGKKLHATFMGGQRTLVRAVPKLKGFKSLRTPAQTVYLHELSGVKATKIDNFVLAEAGLIATPYHSVKIIARGEITKKIDLRVAGASKGVITAITAVGGTFEATPVPLKQSSTDDKKAS